LKEIWAIKLAKINLAAAKGFVKAPNSNLQHSAKVTNLIIHINFRASRAAAGINSKERRGVSANSESEPVRAHSKMLSQLQRNTIINETSMAITNATADTQGAAPDLLVHAGGGRITNSSDQIFPQRAVWQCGPSAETNERAIRVQAVCAVNSQ
jgi:hypothetical protein